MPLSVAVRRSLVFGLKSQTVANEIVAVVNAGTGTLLAAADQHLRITPSVEPIKPRPALFHTPCCCETLRLSTLRL